MGTLPPGLKATCQTQSDKVFLLVRFCLLFGKKRSPQVLPAAFHYVKLARVGMLAARDLRK